MSGKYTPVSLDQMEASLAKWGAVPVTIRGVRERVFEIKYSHRCYVRVFTSIEGSSTRSVGKDAVKVVAVAKWEGVDHIVSHTKRVNRVGGEDAILERLDERITEIMDLKPRPPTDSRGKPMTLRKNRRDGSLFWGQPDWSSIPPSKRETRPFRHA